MNSTKDIVRITGNLFKRYGLKSITMDDVAKELGMSKKTLYKIFTDKLELVETILLKEIVDLKKTAQDISEKAEDPISELLLFNKFITEILTAFNPAILYDLRKYYQEIYEKIKDDFMSMLNDFIHQNIKKGIESGVYRKDINADMITKYHVIRISHIFYSDLIPISEIISPNFVSEIFMYHIRGLTNSKGIRKLKEINNIEIINKTETI